MYGVSVVVDLQFSWSPDLKAGYNSIEGQGGMNPVGDDGVMRSVALLSGNVDEWNVIRLDLVVSYMVGTQQEVVKCVDE